MEFVNWIKNASRNRTFDKQKFAKIE